MAILPISARAIFLPLFLLLPSLYQPTPTLPPPPPNVIPSTPAAPAKPTTPPAPSTPAAAPTNPPANPAITPVARKDDWWVARHNAMNARIKQAAANGDADILFIGDSITQGWEGAGKPVWDEFYGKRNAVNLGIGGDRTQHVLYRLQNGNIEGLDKPAKGTPPKLAIIMIGTNNVSDTPAPQTAEGITAIVNHLRTKLPSTKILLLAIFPREQTPGKARERNTQVNTIIKDLADNTSIFYMDIANQLLNTDGTISKEVMPDFLHLSEDGYRRWAAAIEPKVVELLGTK